MNKKIDYLSKEVKGEVKVSGSKSESNRLLILKEFYPGLVLENLSDSDDTLHLQKALSSDNEVISIGHAGTAMRFLTAFFSAKEGRRTILTGSDRMLNRPIKILAEALQSLGADVQYLDKEGYPPLRITGKRLLENKVRIPGNVSSQYISALLLIAPSLKNGLEIELVGNLTSAPYLKMTLSLLDQIGISYTWKENTIKIDPKKEIEPNTITVESDWSSASYFYSMVALNNKGSVKLSSYRKDSLQGDISLVEIYKHFGVFTKFEGNTITITKPEKIKPKPLRLDLTDSPDLAQTIIVTCFGLGMACDLNGLHTLKIKETDRLIALETELTKLGARVESTDNSIHLKVSEKINKNIRIKTYNDHRMAMAFAPLALKVPIEIEDAEVVTKSYPNFWEDIESVLV